MTWALPGGQPAPGRISPEPASARPGHVFYDAEVAEMIEVAGALVGSLWPVDNASDGLRWLWAKPFRGIPAEIKRSSG